MSNNVFIYIFLGHKSFPLGKICIIEMSKHYAFIDPFYREPAIEKVCEKLGLNKDEVSLLDFKYLGEDVSIFKC